MRIGHDVRTMIRPPRARLAAIGRASLAAIVGGAGLWLGIAQAQAQAQAHAHADAKGATPDAGLAPAVEAELPPGPGREDFVNACSECHPLSMITGRRETRAE